MRKALQSEKLVQKKRKRILWRVLFVFTALILFIAIPALVSHADFMTVDTITIENAEVVDQARVELLVKEKLEGSYYYFFAKSNSLLFPRNEIEREIELRFPRVKKAELRLNGLRGANVMIEEREVFALWCPGEAKCFAMDQSGFIFDEAPGFSADVYPVYGSENREKPIGGYFLNEEDVRKVFLFREGLVELGINPQKIFVESPDYVIAQYPDRKEIVLSLQDEVGAVLSNLDAVLKDPEAGAFENGTIVVSKIDLRYGNKVILKKDPE